MTARPHYDSEAGSWVAYDTGIAVIKSNRLPAWHPGGYTRSYLWSESNGFGGLSLTSVPTEALRYDTKAEALAAASTFARRPGAARVAQASKHRETWAAKVAAARPKNKGTS